MNVLTPCHMLPVSRPCTILSTCILSPRPFIDYTDFNVEQKAMQIQPIDWHLENSSL